MKSALWAAAVLACILAVGCEQKNANSPDPQPQDQSASLDTMDSQNDPFANTNPNMATNTGQPSESTQEPIIVSEPPPDEPTKPAGTNAGAKKGGKKASAGGKIHTVQKGETLSAISRKYYGENRWKDIYEANRDKIKNPDQLEVGTKLRIP